MLPHVIRFNGPTAESMYGQLMHGAGQDNGHPADGLARRIGELMKSAGLPAHLSQCGVSRDILPLLAEEASSQWTARFNPRPVDESDLLRIYEAAW
jgi:alcohol dehydrogenase class IV